MFGARGFFPLDSLRMAQKDNQGVEQWSQIAKQSAYNSRLLASSLNICPRQLQRHTRQLFNKSPQQWLDDMRLEDAILMLQNDSLIKKVAFELGFKTVSHFSNKFKARYGMSPKEFKHKHFCHRSLQNQPAGVESKPATLRCFIHIKFFDSSNGF
jgi:AraC-like DNA-binding protein